MARALHDFSSIINSIGPSPGTIIILKRREASSWRIDRDGFREAERWRPMPAISFHRLEHFSSREFVSDKLRTSQKNRVQ